LRAKEKIRIVLEALRGEDSIVELCRRGINTNVYYHGSKEFLEDCPSTTSYVVPHVLTVVAADAW